MMRAQLYFELPPGFRPYADVLSANAQMYLRCESCGWERRANILYGIPPRALLTEPCGECQAVDYKVVRHLQRFRGHCADCGQDLAGTTSVPWAELSCARCRSHRLEIEGVEIDPPYPKTFGEIGDRSPFRSESDVAKDHPWGVDAGSDAGQLRLEMRQVVHFHPADSYAYVCCEMMFAESLLVGGSYAEDDENLPVLVAQLASMLRDYFRQMGQLPAGLRALQLDELAVEMEKNPPNRAAWEHNAAITINSLLLKYPEEVIEEATARPEIRQEGIAYAMRALRFYAEEVDRERDSAESGGAERDDSEERDDEGNENAEDLPQGLTCANQMARTFHLIGDLLRIGKSTNEERRKALEAYEAALQWGMPGQLVPLLRQSRGETTLMLDDATPEELAAAWQDLEASLSADTKRLGRSMPWAVLWHMAQIAARLDDHDVELEMLDKAARVAMAVVRQHIDEYGLQERSSPMAPVFDALAHQHALKGEGAKALSAAEALRAATVRLHTKTEEEKAEDLRVMVGQAGADLARAHLRQMGHEVNVVESVLASDAARIDSIEPALESLLALDDEIPTAVVSYSNPIDYRGARAVAAFVCVQNGKRKLSIQTKLLQPRFEGMAWDESLVRPGPFRERRLNRMHAAVAAAFVSPLVPMLKGAHVKRILFSLPAPLSRYAFEAAALAEGEQGTLVAQWEVGYLPSIALAIDQARNALRKVDELLVVGYQGDDLTNAAGEIDRLRQLFGKSMTLLSGKACTKVNVLEHLAKPYGYVHFVCHGTYDAELPLNAALHLVPDIEDDSQRVTAGDIFANVKFDGHPVITMSACSTALMSMSPVNNCHGLTGSFLRAGARGVVGSRWPVYDATSATFMTALYQKLLNENASPLGCVAAIQRELVRDHGIEDFASFGYMGLP